MGNVCVCVSQVAQIPYDCPTSAFWFGQSPFPESPFGRYGIGLPFRPSGLGFTAHFQSVRLGALGPLVHFMLYAMFSWFEVRKALHSCACALSPDVAGTVTSCPPPPAPDFRVALPSPRLSLSFRRRGVFVLAEGALASRGVGGLWLLCQFVWVTYTWLFSDMRFVS